MIIKGTFQHLKKIKTRDFEADYLIKDLLTSNFVSFKN